MDGRSYRKESAKEKEMICFKYIKYASFGHLCHNIKNMYVREDVHVIFLFCFSVII